MGCGSSVRAEQLAQQACARMLERALIGGPPSSNANGTKLCLPPWILATGRSEVLSTYNFMSSTSLAANPGISPVYLCLVFL
jgi:hypothetical protein